MKKLFPAIMVAMAFLAIFSFPRNTYATGVKTQLCMVVDGSGSISASEWTTIKNGLATAINDTVPRDGTVEIAIVQFGYSAGTGYAKTEVPPTVVDNTNYATIVSQVLAMPKGGQSTPMAHGLYLGWKELRNSPNFAFSAKQVINLATDGVPNVRNNNATADLDDSGSTNAYDDVIAVVNQAASQGLDELDMEGIGSEAESKKDWFSEWTVRPQPGIIAPPFTKPGWVRIVANVTEFADTVSQKFELILTNAKIQLCMVLDGSGSISASEWNITKKGLANATRDTIPHDGSVELSIVQFGYSSSNGYVKVELQPTIVTEANFQTISNTVMAMAQGKSNTPMAHGLYLGWKTLESSINFQTATKQIINLATDGDPNVRNHNATTDLDGSGTVNYDDDVIAVVNYAVSQGLDELDAEGIGISNSSRNWLKNWVLYPQPGNLAPPFVPGWIRVVANITQFADTVGEKFQAVLVDDTPPTIFNVYQQPAEDNVTFEDNVEVFANVTDDLSGVKTVTLNYTVNNSESHVVEMSNLQGNLYNATIPNYPLGTNITYVLTAEDFANNTITTQEMGYYYGYQVIPEFAIPLMATLFLTATLLAVATRIRKYQK